MGITPSLAVDSAGKLSSARQQEHGSMFHMRFFIPNEFSSLTTPNLQALGLRWNADRSARRSGPRCLCLDNAVLYVCPKI